MKEEKLSNLRKLRLDKGLTIKELADSIKTNSLRIQRYETGFKDINKAEAGVVYKLAKALDCKMEDILEM